MQAAREKKMLRWLITPEKEAEAECVISVSDHAKEVEIRCRQAAPVNIV